MSVMNDTLKRLERVIRKREDGQPADATESIFRQMDDVKTGDEADTARGIYGDDSVINDAITRTASSTALVSDQPATKRVNSGYSKPSVGHPSAPDHNIGRAEHTDLPPRGKRHDTLSVLKLWIAFSSLLTLLMFGVISYFVFFTKTSSKPPETRYIMPPVAAYQQPVAQVALPKTASGPGTFLTPKTVSSVKIISPTETAAQRPSAGNASKSIVIAKEPDDPVLTGIMLNKDTPLAVINGQILGENEELPGLRIIKIKNSVVDVLHNGKMKRLFLKR